MKLTKIERLSQAQTTSYKGQQNVRRLRESKGGYDNIIIATDQDLD